jgi:hypothetical protein
VLPQAFDCMQFNLVPFAAAQFNCAKPIPGGQAGGEGCVPSTIFFTQSTKHFRIYSPNANILTLPRF